MDIEVTYDEIDYYAQTADAVALELELRGWKRFKDQPIDWEQEAMGYE